MRTLCRRWPTSVGVITAVTKLGSDMGVAVRALFGLAALAPLGCDHDGLRVVHLNFSLVTGGNAVQTHQGCWRSNDFMRPVLKHGPRSLTCMRVLE